MSDQQDELDRESELIEKFDALLKDCNLEMLYALREHLLETIKAIESPEMD